jgi:ABC-2 type transport system permease protein
MNTKTRAATESIAFLAIVGVILVVLNIVAAKFSLGRMDFTRTHAYSLSSGSKDLARGLTDQMEITAYFSENEQLGEQYVALQRSVEDLLEEYRAASNGKIKIRVINPSTEAERAAATSAGVTPAQQQVLRDDSVSVVEGYRGLTIQYLGNTKAIPVIAGTDGLEYQITSLMKEVIGVKTRLGVLTGHEGPTLAEGLTSLKRALPNYELVEVNAAEPIPTNLPALIIVGPETALTEPELRNIDTYVMQGHSLGIFGGGIKLNLEGGAPSAAPVDSGLNRLLRPWGVEMRSDIVLDARCDRIPYPGPNGQQRVVQYPPLPIVVFDEAAMRHPALYQIPQARLAFVSSIFRRTAPANATVRMLGKSSERSIRVDGASIDLAPEALPRAHVTGEGTSGMIAVIEGRLRSAFATAGQSTPAGEAPPTGPQSTAQDVRIMVVGTSSLVRDEFLPPAERVELQQLISALAVPLNMIDWLTNDRALIAIRAKTVDDPALDVPSAVELATNEAVAANEAGNEAGVRTALAERTEAIEAWTRKKDLYKFLNWLGIPVLLALFGIIRWRMRIAQKAALAR